MRWSVSQVHHRIYDSAYWITQAETIFNISHEKIQKKQENCDQLLSNDTIVVEEKKMKCFGSHVRQEFQLTNTSSQIKVKASEFGRVCITQICGQDKRTNCVWEIQEKIGRKYGSSLLHTRAKLHWVFITCWASMA